MTNTRSGAPASQLATSRQAIRNQVRARRRALSSHQQSEFALAAAQHTMQYLKQIGANSVALYLASDGELDTTPLIQHLWQADIETYLPLLHPFSPGNLLFLQYHSQSPLKINRYGIPEPRLDVRRLIPVAQLDVIITPLVAFDGEGNRMGMGGGFYDRTLGNMPTDGSPKAGRPRAIGFAHDCQRVPSLPCEPWDVPLQAIITPTGLLEF
jgi:5-formyltetrahydrofolate cyclo-ligase